MKLHAKQWDALQVAKSEPVSAFLAGIRGGKTICGSHYALDNLAERPNEVGAIFSNTTKQLNTATLKEFKMVLSEYGIYENTHYLINKNPEGTFPYRSKFPAHDGIWSFFNGAQIVCFSLEAQIRGVEFGWAWGDEIQDAKLEELEVVLGRMSGSANPKTFYTLTPPKDNPEIDELIYSGKMPVTVSTTYDNAKNLPPGYIDTLYTIYDPITFAREVMCERKPMSGLNWLYSFNRDKHVNETAKYNEKELLYLSFDFNNNPFVCVMSHRGIKKGQKHGYIHYFDTVVLKPEQVHGQSYIEAIAQAVKLKAPYQFERKSMIITGDASGSNQSILNRVGENIWVELLRAFGVGRNNLILPKKNPFIKDSRTLCNSIFSNYDEVFINPLCRELIRDCEFVKAKPDDTILKDNRKNITQQADLLDALRYDLNAFNRNFVRLDK